MVNTIDFPNHNDKWVCTFFALTTIDCNFIVCACPMKSSMCARYNKLIDWGDYLNDMNHEPIMCTCGFSFCFCHCRQSY